jgi:hypothetical protein
LGSVGVRQVRKTSITAPVSVINPNILEHLVFFLHFFRPRVESGTVLNESELLLPSMNPT